jgi:hypothetical protein
VTIIKGADDPHHLSAFNLHRNYVFAFAGRTDDAASYLR